MKKPLNLSEMEWQVMQFLWEKGVKSVKDVWQTLYPEKEKAYTTVQTYMDRMVEKKLLEKQKIGLVNFYFPLLDKQTLRRQATETLVSKAFNGSFLNLAAFLVNSKTLSEDELDEIREIIRRKEEG